MIRVASHKDKKRIESLWRECFTDTPSFVAWYFNEVFNPENTFLAENDGEVVASLQICQYDMIILNEHFKAFGIWGVCTAEKERNKGYMRSLMEYSFCRIKERGGEIALLCPAVTGMYEKFGFSEIYKIERYKISDDAFEYNGEYNMALFDTIKRIYFKHIKEKDVYINRDDKDIENIIREAICDESIRLYVRDDGYLIATKDDGEVTVLEGFGFSLERCPKENVIMAKCMKEESFIKKLDGKFDLNYGDDIIKKIFSNKLNMYINFPADI